MVMPQLVIIISGDFLIIRNFFEYGLLEFGRQQYHWFLFIISLDTNIFITISHREINNVSLIEEII